MSIEETSSGLNDIASIKGLKDPGYPSIIDWTDYPFLYEKNKIIKSEN